MTEAEVLQIMADYYASLFPKVCPRCARSFATLQEYVELTTPAGRYISYDIDAGSWTPEMGTFALANCPCGDTLAMTTDALPHPTRVRLLEWVKVEAKHRAIEPLLLMDYLRVELRRRLVTNRAQFP